MKPFILLSKQKLFLTLSLTVLFLSICFIINFTKTPCKDAVTKENRMEFLSSFGYEETNETSKEIVIPKSFNKTFEEYNESLKKQGYDLGKYKGKEATLYTYSYNDFEVQIIVCNDEIISAVVLKNQEFKFLSKNEKK